MPDLPIARREFFFSVTVPASGAAFASAKSLLSATQLAALGTYSSVDGYIVAPSTDAVQRRDGLIAGDVAAAIAGRPNDYHEVPIGVSWPMPSGDWLSSQFLRMKTNVAANVLLIVYVQ